VFLPFPKATLLVVSGTQARPDVRHLFVILTKPLGDANEVLMVGLSSIHPDVPFDASCTIYSGEHPFVRHETYVRYDRARLEPARKLIDGVRTGVFVPQSPVSDVLYKRICVGLTSSTQASPKVKAHLRWHEDSA
jgi:hypothetical protein